jgi:hypothetical protein
MIRLFSGLEKWRCSGARNPPTLKQINRSIIMQWWMRCQQPVRLVWRGGSRLRYASSNQKIQWWGAFTRSISTSSHADPRLPILQGGFSCCVWHLYETFTLATVHHPLKQWWCITAPGLYLLSTYAFQRDTRNVFTCSRNRRVAGLFLFPNLVRTFYKFYGCCCFVLEKYLRVWDCRDSSVTVMSTEEVAFDSQQGEVFVLRSVQPSFLFNRYSLTSREGPGTYWSGGLSWLQSRSGSYSEVGRSPTGIRTPVLSARCVVAMPTVLSLSP